MSMYLLPFDPFSHFVFFHPVPPTVSHFHQVSRRNLCFAGPQWCRQVHHHVGDLRFDSSNQRQGTWRWLVWVHDFPLKGKNRMIVFHNLMKSYEISCRLGTLHCWQVIFQSSASMYPMIWWRFANLWDFVHSTTFSSQHLGTTWAFASPEASPALEVICLRP